MNFSPGSDRKTRGVRWNKELELYEMRCADCADERHSNSFWPLTPEFWDHRSLQRCRACEGVRNRIARRTAYAANRVHELTRQHEYDRLYRTSRATA